MHAMCYDGYSPARCWCYDNAKSFEAFRAPSIVATKIHSELDEWLRRSAPLSASSPSLPLSSPTRQFVRCNALERLTADANCIVERANKTNAAAVAAAAAAVKQWRHL